MNVVLVHGILGFRERLGIEYFNGVARHFRGQGHRVIAPVLDPTRGIEFRGSQLAAQVTAAFGKGDLDPAAKTHIIAHSMGGLDSRWMLSPANPARIQASIRSLTTISTPHQGSVVADLAGSPGLLSPFLPAPFRLIPNPLESMLNVLGISLDGLRDLTTASCQAFSAKSTDDPAVAYFSVAGSGRAGGPATALAFLALHAYVSAQTGEPNDGLVPISSARCGKFDANTWPCDHAEEIGHNLDNLLLPPSFPWLAHYDRILENLAAV